MLHRVTQRIFLPNGSIYYPAVISLGASSSAQTNACISSLLMRSNNYHGTPTVATTMDTKKSDNGGAAAYFAHKTVMIPHDQKRQTAGEDAAAANDNLLVVADGVGGWARHGVNPAAFSRALTHTILELAPSFDNQPLAELVQSANLKVASQYLGSSTCTTLKLASPTTMETLNVGDSGYSIFRRENNNNNNSSCWEMVYKSEVGQKRFNFPYQLGGVNFGDDARVVGIATTHTVEENDIVVVFSDGVSDNLDPQQFPKLVLDKLIAGNKGIASDEDLQGAADGIARIAYFLGKDQNYISPFAIGAREAGWGISYSGGKHDDITVMVAQVRPGTKLAKVDEASILLYVGHVEPFVPKSSL